MNFPRFFRPFPALLLGLCVLFPAPPVFSLGRRDKPSPGPPQAGASLPSPPSVSGPEGLIYDGDQVELAGRVRLVGSEPFPDLVLTGEDGKDWYLEGPDRQALRSREQQIIRLRGRVELREMVLANGRSLGFRRFLRDVEILE